MKLEGQPNIQSLAESPPPRGRGLKQQLAHSGHCWEQCRPPRGGVD